MIQLLLHVRKYTGNKTFQYTGNSSMIQLLLHVRKYTVNKTFQYTGNSSVS